MAKAQLLQWIVAAAWLLALAQQSSSFRLQDLSAFRGDRSGGFPKFPVEASTRSSQCGARKVNFASARSPKVVGGVEPPYGAYPWQVDIKLYKSEEGDFGHHCGGSIIAPRLVLTAAHCLQQPIQADQLRVVAGEHVLGVTDQHEVSYKVDKFLVHHDFRKLGPYSNDIALLRIAKEDGILFGPFVTPVCLPESDDTPPPGSWCTVSGWGAQSGENLDTLSDVLRSAQVPLIDLDTCRQPGVYGGRQQAILDSMVCAGRLQGGVDACGGDSGGPLACEVNGHFTLAGIVSWGDGCAKKNRPGVYTRVASYTEWIKNSAISLGVTL